MQKQRSTGWTLVEVLVVLAIGMIVISLYGAVVDKAQYEAMLTICQSQQRAIGTAAITYAGEYQRHYPYRPGVFEDPNWSPAVIVDVNPNTKQPTALAQRTATTRSVIQTNDDRVALTGYLDINKQLNCEMVKPVDLESSTDYTRVQASQALWYGWRFTDGERVERAMLRQGDRFEWNGKRFAILASDWTAFSREDNVAIGSHPDFYDGYMWIESVENQRSVYWQTEPSTYSFWVTPETSWPGPVDRVFTGDDGAVRRFTRVQWRARTDPEGNVLRGEQNWEKIDERTVRVPERADNDPTRSSHLPREGY